jgi:hypothetical protein
MELDEGIHIDEFRPSKTGKHVLALFRTSESIATFQCFKLPHNNGKAVHQNAFLPNVSLSSPPVYRERAAEKNAGLLRKAESVTLTPTGGCTRYFKVYRRAGCR